VTNTLQQRISNRRVGAASAALALAVVLLSAVTTTQVAQAQTFTTLVSFDNTNGANPYYTSLIQGTNGDFYGPTAWGGANGLGTLFKITPEGKLATFSFDGTDGAAPYGAAVQATNGYFYGTTTGGGTSSACGSYGCGTVFKITSAGKLTTLYNFCSQANCTDGYVPVGGLVQATNGYFYGTTALGGANGGGTIFEITPKGKLTTLYSFTGGTDGYYPLWLVQGTNGDFYGTTNFGGGDGYGTVFKITAAGTLTTLHSFDGSDGSYPNWLVQATNGNFYGTTSNGGVNDTCTGGCGTVFKITPAGKLTTLYNFCSQANCADGGEPNAGLVQATNGNFYGTTYGGGANDSCGASGSVSCGTVFEITAAGTLTTLHSFDGTDGFLPNGLVQATNGTFYGTAEFGGANDDGTVFSLSVGLGPFVETLPTSGKVGAAVKILGTNLTGATSVTFNGTAAAFKVVSKSLITTSVPTGATTGTVEVTTPKGTLKSNVVFRVTK